MPEAPPRRDGCALILGVVVVFVPLAYCSNQSGPGSPATPSEADTSTSSLSEPRPAPPFFRTTASLLYHDYMVNAVAAQDRIGGSPVELSGWVSGIDLDAAENVVVHLYTGRNFADDTQNDPAEMLMDSTERVQARSLHVLDRVRVRCTTVRLEGGLLMHGEGCVFTGVNRTPESPDAQMQAAGEADLGEHEDYLGTEQ